MRLSTNFTLEEFLISQTAERHGIDMSPPPNVTLNLKRLVENVLQPFRDAIGVPIIVTSGYRTPELNRLIGGSERSQHMQGEAADIRAIGMPPSEIWSLLSQSGLPIHQLIHEFGRWVHVSVAPYGLMPQKEYFSAVREDGKTVYKPGLVV